MQVQTPVGIPHGVPVEGRVREALSSWDGTDAHEGCNYTSSVQTADAVDGVDPGHGHGQRHRGGRVEARCGGGSLCGPLLLLLSFLFHFDLTVLLLVLIRLVLLIQDVPRQTIGPVQAVLSDVGRRGAPAGGFIFRCATVQDHRSVLITVLAVFELLLLCTHIFPAVRVLPVFGLVLVSVRISRRRRQRVPGMLWRSAVAQ